jgi:hypothetical protein
VAEVESCVGDVTDPGVAHRATEGADLVVHCDRPVVDESTPFLQDGPAFQLRYCGPRTFWACIRPRGGRSCSLSGFSRASLLSEVMVWRHSPGRRAGLQRRRRTDDRARVHGSCLSLAGLASPAPRSGGRAVARAPRRREGPRPGATGDDQTTESYLTGVLFPQILHRTERLGCHAGPLVRPCRKRVGECCGDH